MSSLLSSREQLELMEDLVHHGDHFGANLGLRGILAHALPQDGQVDLNLGDRVSIIGSETSRIQRAFCARLSMAPSSAFPIASAAFVSLFMITSAPSSKISSLTSDT